MKVELNIQFQGKEISENEILSKFKELWKEQGKRIKDIETLNLYLNLNDNRVYYVVNDNENGSI